MDRENRRDLVFGSAILVIAGIYFRESLHTPIPATTLDPIGPAVPVQGVCFFMAAFAIALLAKVFLSGASPRKTIETAEKEGDGAAAAVPNAGGLAVATYLLTVLYVVILGTRVLPFAVTTTAFVLATGLVLTRATWRKIPGLLILALIIGFGTAFIFTRIVYVDLP